MHKFFSNKKLIILMVLVIIMIGMLAVSVNIRNKKSTPPVVQQFGNDVVGITARIVSVPANGIRSGLDTLGNLVNTYEENQKLKAQVDDLAQTKVTVQTLKQENKALKKELKLNDTLTDYTSLNASVMLRSPDNWQNTILIDRGSSSGIKKDQSVMSGSGLIGRVIEVNKTNAKVELISTDNKSANRFAAQITTSDNKTVTGIITGFDETSSDLVFGQLNTDANIKVGDKVSTSGLGGLTPKGLFIGKVVKIKKDDYGLATSVYVKPAANLDDFSVVTVISRTIAGD